MPLLPKGGIAISERVTDEERLARIKTMFPDPDEAADILAYDKAVERGEPTQYDLPPDKAKIAQKFAHTGTRKTPTVFQFSQRQRKPNATKGGLIAEFADFLENHSEFSVEDVQVVNKERQIAFKVGDDSFELTLVQKRKPK